MAEQADLVEGGAANVRDMFVVGEAGIKFNPEVTSMGAWSYRYATEGDGGVSDFGALLGGTNKEEFSFCRVDSKAV